MKFRIYDKLRIPLAVISIAVLSLLFSGCEGDESGPAEDYNGSWKGRTSEGGSVVFVVSGDQVTQLRIIDSRAEMWALSPVAIDGHSFSVKSESLTDFSGSSISGTFDSPTHCGGKYSVITMGWEGTFEASRK